MLSSKWAERKKSYDFIIVGSGYGGAVTAARIATADLNPKPSLCILERGREWQVGKFPDTLRAVSDELLSGLNPFGLYEILNYRDISVMKGSGLGGTSLINANVAATPDEEVFEHPDWPRSLTFSSLEPYYRRAKQALGVQRHPHAWDFPKVHAMQRRARQLGLEAFPLELAINFEFKGVDENRVVRKPCIGCGDCVTGCNNHAKQTLYMNYLPIARRAGAQIFTETKVERIEKLPDGGWRVHVRNYEVNPYGGRFSLDTRNVILAASSINTSEILLRSEAHGLSLSPMVGTRFSANGDFFGLAYNGDYRTQVTGFGNNPEDPAAEHPPGPAIVSAIHYNGNTPVHQRVQVEDLSFPRAYVRAARTTFAALRGEDSDTGDEEEERRRVKRDLNPGTAYHLDGALNHTMLYLVMSFDDARGRMVLETSWSNPDGRVRVVWDEAGRQSVYTRLNEELRRHARAQGASFISNPLWSFMDVRHLMTAHPIGGCPLGEDYAQGAVDEFGRVFSGDGDVHEGLFVADGSIIPSSIGVNPFLTISALAEWIAERKIREMQGDAYPKPPVSVSLPGVDPFEATQMEEAELERLFQRCPTLGVETMVNSGQREIDLAERTIRNDTCWKGFFPKRHVLNAMSSAVFTGFKKEFRQEDGQLVGVTSDTDGRIRARNTLEEVTIDKRTDDLDAGRYILLRYLDSPWQGFYDLFKVINEDLLIGRVYLGTYPNGSRLFTFPMTRHYRLSEMTLDDHSELYKDGAVPAPEQLDGAWRMDLVSNANQARGFAYLRFDHKPDGRLECRYQMLGLLEGLIMPQFLSDHFRLTDFTPFRDEIRIVAPDYMVGRYVTDLPEGLPALGSLQSLGLLHAEGQQLGFYYTLTRVERKQYPANILLRPFLEVQLPDGLGMTFDEEMVGWFAPGEEDPRRIPAAEKPEEAVECGFRLRMTIRDLNEFIEGWEHEAGVKGTISFGELGGAGPVTLAVDERRSFFKYLRVNQATGEAEMCYHLEFSTDAGKQFTLEGLKYMQKSEEDAGPRTFGEVMEDYTTLYARVYEGQGEEKKQVGTVRLKFRTFEDLAAMASFTEFLRSFRVTGSDDPLLQFQATMRFLAFTAQFVLMEYDPLAPRAVDLPRGRSAAG